MHHMSAYGNAATQLSATLVAWSVKNSKKKTIKFEKHKGKRCWNLRQHRPHIPLIPWNGAIVAMVIILSSPTVCDRVCAYCVCSPYLKDTFIMGGVGYSNGGSSGDSNGDSE
jgi:hypothetical protein